MNNRRRMIWLAGALLAIAGLVLTIHEPATSSRPPHAAAGQAAPSTTNASPALPDAQNAQPEPPAVPPPAARVAFKNDDDRRFAAQHDIGRRCTAAGLLSQAALGELCNLDMSLEQTLQSPLYNRLLIVLMLHPQAETHMAELAAEVRGNVDCDDHAKWGANTHLALMGRGVLDAPLTTQAWK